MTINNQTFIYYFDCTNFYLVKNDANGVYMASILFPSVCFLMRSSSTYLYITGGNQIIVMDYNLNKVQSYTSTCGSNACLNASTGIFYDSATNLIYTADEFSNNIFIYNSALTQLGYISLASYLPTFPLNDIVTYNGVIFALSYTGTSESLIWVINNDSVTAIYKGLCGGGIATYPFIMNCNGYILVPCSKPNAVYLYSSDGGYVASLTLKYPSNGITVDSNGRLISVINGYSDIIEIIQ